VDEISEMRGDDSSTLTLEKHGQVGVCIVGWGLRNKMVLEREGREGGESERVGEKE
jgi:hypothetical protein